MTANVGLTPLVAALLAALAGEAIAAEAHAEANCLAAPGAQSPPGHHWFYRIERTKQRKCWYLRAQGAAEATAAAKVSIRHRLRVASAAPEAKLPAPSEQLVPEIRLDPQASQPVAAAPDDRTIGVGINDGAEAPRRADTEIVAGVLAPAPVMSDNSAALSPTPSDDRAAKAGQGAAERTRQANAMRVVAAQPDTRARDVEDSSEAVAQATPAAASGRVAPLAFVVAGAMLVIAGIFLHPIVQIFARRPVFQAGPEVDVWGTSTTNESTVPGFLARWRDARVDRREYKLDEI